MKKDLTIKDELTEFLLYTAPDGKVKVEVILNNETVWLPQKAIAALFGVYVPAISKHLKNIFESGELQEISVVSILETTVAEYSTDHDIKSEVTREFYTTVQNNPKKSHNQPPFTGWNPI